jgi:hypothetical protein
MFNAHTRDNVRHVWCVLELVNLIYMIYEFMSSVAFGATIEHIQCLLKLKYLFTCSLCHLYGMHMVQHRTHPVSDIWCATDSSTLD